MPLRFHDFVRSNVLSEACFWLLAIAFSGPTICAQETAAPTAGDRFITLQETDPSLNNDPILAGSRVRLDTLHHTLDLDTSPSPYFVVLGAHDPLNIPVEAVIRLRFLKRDLTKASLLTPPVQKALDQIHTQIFNCAHNGAEGSGTLEDAAKSPQCAAVEPDFGHLSDVIIDQAHTMGFTVTHSKGVSAGYRVDFKFSPRPYPLRIMTALEYRKCQILHDSETQYFNNILSDHEFLLGRYYYQLDWPNNLGGVETGFILADAPKTLTFVSKRN